MRTGTSPLIAVRKFRPEDKESLSRIIQSTGVFNNDEIDVAIELLDDVIRHPETRDYEIYTATGEDEEILGYYCLGPTPLTDGTYDLYWIAVKPAAQHQGIGNRLIRHAEELVASQGGRLVVAETSSKPQYEKTREFYIRHHYDELARIRAYYRTGDDLVIYGKYITHQNE